jgi:hypothetical protein
MKALRWLCLPLVLAGLLVYGILRVALLNPIERLWWRYRFGIKLKIGGTTAGPTMPYAEMLQRYAPEDRARVMEAYSKLPPPQKE